MRNASKIIFTIVIVSLMFGALSPPVSAYTDSLSSIDLDVYLQPDGTAVITETWTTEAASGTENYKSFGNLGTSRITEFSVSDEHGRVYEYVDEWNVDATRSEKSGKCGINKTPSGTELCWGIGEYGERVYELKYTVTNIIQQYDDSQALYFQFVQPDMFPVPESVKINIRAEIPFTDDVHVWGYGYDGVAGLADGQVVFESDGSLSTYDYVTALVEFPQGTFGTSDIVSGSFEDVLAEAEEGVQVDEPWTPEVEDEHFSAFDIILMIIGGFFTLIVSFIPTIIFIGIIFFSYRAHKTPGGYDYGAEGRKLPKMKDIPYNRDIPCGKNLLRAYWIGKSYGIISEESQLMGAFLLKWLNDGNIKMIETEGGFLDFNKDDNYAIDFRAEFNTEPGVESALRSLLKSASGDNGILEPKEFEKWCRKNYSKVTAWFTSAEMEAENRFTSEKLITVEERTSLKFFKSKIKVISPKLKEEAVKLLGLKKFLLEFSAISEREMFDVKLWDEYLIFAQLLGIADKVEKQFAALYPSYSELTRLNVRYVTGTRIICHTGVTAAYTAHRMAQSSSGGGRRSGGGGFSSGGGGGGARGSSSGGGRR